MASLTKLIVHCNYNTQFQATLLRDHFVCGLSNESTRKRLLTEGDCLTLERTLEISMSIEKAIFHAKQMKHDLRSPGVHHVSHSKARSPAAQSSTPVVCHHCGGPHLEPSSRFIHETCRLCGKTGHIVKLCCSKPVSAPSTTYQSLKKPM